MADIIKSLKSSPDGLSIREAKLRLETHEHNRLPAAEKEGLLKRFFKHFNDLLIYILILAALITAGLWHYIDTAVILAVVVINAVIGFIQEGKAEEALGGIRKMLFLHAQALRDGSWTQIETEELVPGDMVRLRSGDRVPADLRLIETTNLRIEESALTGESLPVEKKSDPVPTNAGAGDRFCMAYAGTLVTSGRGIGVATHTGAMTELGRINKMIGNVEKLATPLTLQMNMTLSTLTFGSILIQDNVIDDLKKQSPIILPYLGLIALCTI